MNQILQLIIWACRLGVGGLFIFSGLIKANDALGFSYKLKEYFEKFGEIFIKNEMSFLATPMEWMAEIALPMAMFIVVLEIVLGILTIVGAKMRKVSLLLLLLIVFFTFLTFVSWKFDLVKTCGCFGDVWVLTPFQSFMKDIYLLIGILVLFVFRNSIQTLLNPTAEKLTIWSSSIIFFLFTFYCYRHLPVGDFRPYAVGNSLFEQMKEKKGNPLVLYKLQHKTNGVIVEFADYPDDYQNWAPYVDPEDSTAQYFTEVDGELDVKFIEILSTGQKTKVLEIPEEFEKEWKLLKDTSIVYIPDEDPKILDLTFTDIESGEDKMLSILNDSAYRFVLVVRDFNFFGEYETTTDGLVFHKNTKGEKIYGQIKNLFVEAGKEAFEYNILSPIYDVQKIQAFQHEMDTRVKFFECDDTPLKTMIRSSPGLLLLKQDTVIGKWHYNDFPDFEDIKENYIN